MHQKPSADGPQTPYDSATDGARVDHKNVPVRIRSRRKAVCGPQSFTRSWEDGWSSFSGDIGRRNGPKKWFYVGPLQLKRTASAQ